MLRLTLLLFAAGCSLEGQSNLDADARASIQTDALVYTAQHEGGEGTYAQYGFRLVARFTNPLPDTVYLGRAYPDSPHPIFGLGSLAYNGIVQGVGHDRQFAVAPGGTRTDTLHVWGPSLWDGQTGAFDGELEGLTRLTYQALSCRRDPCRLADSVAVSNVFEVRLE